MAIVPLSTTPSNAVKDHHPTQHLNLVKKKEEERDKLNPVHQRHQRIVRQSLATVVILIPVQELYLMVCVLEVKITNAVQECHSRKMNVLLLEELVETFVDVMEMERYFMDIVLLSTTPSNAVKDHHQTLHLDLKCVK